MMHNLYPTSSSPCSSPISPHEQNYALIRNTPTCYQIEALAQGDNSILPPLTRLYTSMLIIAYQHTVLSGNQNASRIWHPPIVPLRFKVYYLPDGKHIPQWSIVHVQKHQDGFFKHPVLVVDVDEKYVYFYAMTRQPPHAIAELGMCLRIGASHQEEGLDTLRLASGSQRMHHETWINLEQCFKIEKHLLRYWSHDVNIAESEWSKLRWKVENLEAQQNRFIYKPISRDLSQVQAGTIILMPNARGSATLGAPVVVLENQYPHFRFLRVKSMAENIIFQEPRSPRHCRARQNCLAITPTLQYGHDSTPVMILEPWSPDLREKSYVEINRKPKWGRLDKCQTWCWPPIVVQTHSIKVLYNYIARLPPPTVGPMARTQGRDWETHPQWDRTYIQTGYSHITVAGTREGHDHLGTSPIYGDMYSYGHHLQANSTSSRESSAEPRGM